MPESFVFNCECPPQGRGTVPPSLLPYVYSVNDLQGQITLAGTGAVDISSLGNTITIDVSAEAGLGSVTSVALSSSSSNLTVVSGSPITTNGTITLNLAGNIGSIASLSMLANEMLYSTAADTFAKTALVANGRTLIGHTFAQMRADLDLEIGTDVQAWSADLDAFVSAASWSSDDLTLSGDLTIAGNWVGGGTGSFAGALTVFGLLSGAAGASFSGNVDAGTFSGVGTSLTALNASNISSGTLAVARGGTNIASYAVGDLLYAGATTTLSKLTSVAAGSYLRSGGLVTAPVWSTLVLPNAATVGDIFSSSTTNTMSRITAVATGNALISGGVATLPSWGKITSGHVDSTIATISGGVNANISSFSGGITFSATASFSSTASFFGALEDASAFAGDSGNILTSTGTGVAWSTQIAVDTIRVDGLISSEATVTAAGVTGAQTINKMTGTVRFAAAASTLVITNSLALAASTRALATPCSNDTTLKSVCAVVTNGFITLTANAAATAETEVFWELRGLT